MDERKYWLLVVEQFRNDINAVIICPSCKKGSLNITDVAFDDTNITKGGERYIQCPICKKSEIVLYRIAPENWYSKNK
jgi:hypothetical protein